MASSNPVAQIPMNHPIDIIKDIFPAACHDHIFLVGGAVRDLLLGRLTNDIDLVAVLTPEEMVSSGFRLVTGRSTIPIWFRHDEHSGSLEATLIRNLTDLDADLARRDFTINAMAMSLSEELIDPLNGRIDLEQGVLHACTPQTFNADPLRIFRALRLAADGWKLDLDTKELIWERDWSDVWVNIPMERFSREMLKAMSLQEPDKFFQRMLKYQVGETYLPEIFRMQSIPAGPLIHHPEGDLFTHSCQVLQRVATVSSCPLARFCGMFHDIGKLATSPQLYPKHHGHDRTGFALSLEFCQRLRLPTHYGKALSWISRLHGTFNLWDQLRDVTKLRLADQAIQAGVVDILPLVAAADKEGGHTPEEWGTIVALAGMSAQELDIDLQHLEEMKPTQRSDYILQIRVEKLRSTRTTST